MILITETLCYCLYDEALQKMVLVCLNRILDNSGSLKNYNKDKGFMPIF